MYTKKESFGIILYRKRRGKYEFLLLRSYNNKWLIPKGGKLNNNESNRACAIRELYEETNIKLNIYDIERNFKIKNKVYIKPKKYLKTMQLYIADGSKITPEMIVINPEEHKYYKWITYGTFLKEGMYTDIIKCLNLVNNHLRTKEKEYKYAI